MKKLRFNKKQKKQLKQLRSLGILLFIFAMLLGFVVGLMFFIRPDKSVSEKRLLTEFPEFTISSFLDGSFFSQVSLWFSDTYPGRDTLIAADQSLKSVYGIKTSTMMVGGGTGDDIPIVEEDEDESTEVASADTGDDTSEGGEGESTESGESEGSEEAEATPTPQPKVEVDPPDAEAMQAAIQSQIQQGLYVKNGAAYSVYYFNQNACKIYTDALNKAAEKLAGQANVYSILVPNQSGAMLPEDELKSLGGSDQIQAIQYYYSLYDNVTGIKTIETLREHNDEYLYFRTDHHWTQLGAWYVYRNFCEAKGWTPHELSEFETMVFTPFLGTFYSELGNAEMAANPDTVTAYVPNGTNDMTFWDTNGQEIKWHVIEDVSTWNNSSGYYCYIGGDKPMSIIENPNITDGSSCLVLKESYGNCFVPFLVDHYQTIYIVDFRYANVNVVNYVQEKGIKDLIVMNNITIAAGEQVASTIAGLL